ncbi:hypothetical protein SARC_13810 [Sphaeroforma arctica JP610]|uniref:Uncharacterized protein n=1 Tax=Sphaeroforma arctica JP610 TaxID=667725 RepID=A0A0L0FAV4_9EUKA|nr:hypothetical protein SARC_13810 [Sphaeroforma arctica JP610]KNC73631.1 hypothetical protein SARC_13810 [Sphaeroforma arctica JP610]|eukprot:XP_014147533.1 hypothetical protein SARC_13810 [Sphaeroforma arctica JP610]
MLKNLRNIVKSWPKDPTKDSRDLGRALVGFVDRKYGNVEGNKQLMQQAEADSEALKKLLNGEARIAVCYFPYTL